MNTHWLPLSLSRCGYCQVPFTVILKTEELALDMKFVGQMSGVNLTSQTVENPSKGPSSSMKQSREYLSRLDSQARAELYQVYKVDFEMFQYSPDGYY